MGEPTCVMQPFSYTTSPTPFYNESLQEINPIMYGLKESISFGKYAYEDLEWEKWSCFNSDNRNKHVAEAEKYSKPGSVAQKKAYFEAHFKKIAALKSAALQTNDIQQSKDSDTGDFVVQQNAVYSTQAKKDENVINNHKGNEVNPSPPPPPPLPDYRSSQKHEVIAVKNEYDHVRNEESSREIIKQMEIPILKEESTEIVKKKRTPLSSYISSPPVVIVIAPSPDKSDLIDSDKENDATPIKDIESSINGDPQKTRSPLRKSFNREFSRILSPVIKKLGNSSKNSTPKNSEKKLDDKFNATTTQRASQPSKFKAKVEAQLNKFRQIFCFKAMSSQDYYDENGTFTSPKHKNESKQRKSPNEEQQSNITNSQGTSASPPRRPSMEQNGRIA